MFERKQRILHQLGMENMHIFGKRKFQSFFLDETKFLGETVFWKRLHPL